MIMTAQMVRVLSWNIDMDTAPISMRTRALVRHIRHLRPHVVLLQEVTDKTLPILTSALLAPGAKLGASKHTTTEVSKLNEIQKFGNSEGESIGDADAQRLKVESSAADYAFHVDPTWPESLPYFSLMLTHRELFKSCEATATRFPTSRMHRGYIEVQGVLSSGIRAAFITSHLESLKESGEQRKHQLHVILDRQRELASKGIASLFGGDTNLREAEVSAKEVYKTAAAEKKRRAEEGERPKKRRRGAVTAGVPKVVDAWLAAGGDAAEKFTWDMKINNNLTFDAEFKPRARYDRVFLLGSEEAAVDVESFGLVGKERLSCGKFVSDHWGICVDVQFSAKQETKAE